MAEGGSLFQCVKFAQATIAASSWQMRMGREMPIWMYDEYVPKSRKLIAKPRTSASKPRPQMSWCTRSRI